MARTLFKSDDGVLDIIYKSLFPIATLAFLIYSYVNSVKPVFDKYQELQESKTEVQNLAAEKNRLNESLQNTGKELNALREQIPSLKKEAESLTIEVNAKKNDLEKFQNQLRIAAREAVNANVYRLVDKIVRYSIDTQIRGIGSSQDSKFDLQAYCIELANTNIKNLGQVEDGSPKSFELRANLILREFAEKELKPGISDVDPLFNIFIYLTKV